MKDNREGIVKLIRNIDELMAILAEKLQSTREVGYKGSSTVDRLAR